MAAPGSPPDGAGIVHPTATPAIPTPTPPSAPSPLPPTTQSEPFTPTLTTPSSLIPPESICTDCPLDGKPNIAPARIDTSNPYPTTMPTSTANRMASGTSDQGFVIAGPTLPNGLYLRHRNPNPASVSRLTARELLANARREERERAEVWRVRERLRAFRGLEQGDDGLWREMEHEFRNDEERLMFNRLPQHVYLGFGGPRLDLNGVVETRQARSGHITSRAREREPDRVINMRAHGIEGYRVDVEGPLRYWRSQELGRLQSRMAAVGWM
ncbi:hypothetical protein LTR62_001211 [Meristemomyces frigidus]|uniref:Uncharacterized protein n=1 Tax=Meristemomyces frigidus TaxID=1508187 RepID=A0AAN7THG8_9PEZI|nr:hypothetical protein LTR62_001211 [Meristemomyces frigidus]